MSLSLFYKIYQNTVSWWAKFKIIILLKYIRKHTLWIRKMLYYNTGKHTCRIVHQKNAIIPEKHACRTVYKKVRCFQSILLIWSKGNKKLVQLCIMLQIMRIWTNKNIGTWIINNIPVDMCMKNKCTVKMETLYYKWTKAASQQLKIKLPRRVCVLSLNAVREFKQRASILGHSFIC